MVDEDADPVDLRALLVDLEALAASVGDGGVEDAFESTERSLVRASEGGLIDAGVRRLDVRDAAEAFVGCVVFAAPLLVEGGIVDIADYLFGRTVGGVPVFLALNTLFVVLMTYALVEWTGQRRAEVSPILNVVPGRVVMVLAVSFVVSTVLMTLWGRVGGWTHPTEALARITVLWTVGSLGAALGDIVSNDEDLPVDDIPEAPDEVPPIEGDTTDEALVAELHREFDRLDARIDDPAQQRELDRIVAATTASMADRGFGADIRKYTGRDVAEAFVGSVFFSIPLLVEDGVFDVADYLLSVQAGGVPVVFLLNAVFVLVVVHALVYWAGPQDVVATRRIFGVVPRRLVGTTVVAFLTAAMLMTMWGRIAGTTPAVAVGRISVVWTVAAFGAALGDILPGESSGEDLGDELADIGDQVGEFVEELG